MDIEYLLLFFSHQQPRRLRTIENVLIGRKTVSTLFLGMRYHILDFLGIFPSIDQQKNLMNMEYLLTNGYLRKINLHEYLLTDLGQKLKDKIQTNHYLPKYLKWNRNYDVKTIQNRVILATQVISEYSFNNRNYYPFQLGFADAEFIKSWFHHYKNDSLVKEFYRFIYAFLDKLPNDLAWQFATILVGHNNPGMTLSQQANHLNESVFETYLKQYDLFCMLLRSILQSNNEAIETLIYNTEQSFISDSAMVTLNMFKKGISINNISKYRKIKLSTVKEHLQETAILIPKNDFPYRKIFNSTIWETLERNFSGNIDDWSFQTIQEKTNSIDFFHFRIYQILRSKIDG